LLLRNRSPFSALRFISLSLLLIATVLAAIQLVRFSRVRAYFPSGLQIAGVPVGGLDRQQAAQRLLEAYSLPVEMHYGEAIIQLNPSVVDFQLDLDSMLAAADLERTQTVFWQDFWDFMWGRSSSPGEVPLRASYSEARLRTYLSEIAERYDQPPVAAMPVAGTVNFQAGKSGMSLDIDNAILPIENALYSLRNREVELPLERTNPPRPALNNLEILLKQTIDVAGFEGIAGVYMADLQTGQEIHFGYSRGEDLPVQPDIAFTASSIIKIPIMISAFKYMEDNPDSETLKLVSDMIEYSGNESADWLMDRVIDPTRAPLLVTEDMRSLGLENTFLAGYFTIGSPLLAVINTPANERTDVNTDPDPYSQTTPTDIGMLLEDLYICAQNGGGALMAVFPQEFDQAKCQTMIEYLKNNRLPVLLTAGIPEGTKIAHKHGWVSDINAVITTIGDAGIIYSPGGNYVLVVFLYHPEQLVWEPASTLVAELSRAAYNYFNLPGS
jgi:beta-lactamase class A